MEQEVRDRAKSLGWVVVAIIVIAVILGNAQSWFSPAARSPTIVGTIKSLQGGVDGQKIHLKVGETVKLVVGVRGHFYRYEANKRWLFVSANSDGTIKEEEHPAGTVTKHARNVGSVYGKGLEPGTVVRVKDVTP